MVLLGPGQSILPGVQLLVVLLTVHSVLVWHCHMPLCELAVRLRGLGQGYLLNNGCCAADLKFKASSRMKPRWLVIAAVLPTQDVMYVQYNVPTIIMSRACDQLTKASLHAVYHCLAACIGGSSASLCMQLATVLCFWKSKAL